jgi:thiol:disulfide interchange protein
VRRAVLATRSRFRLRLVPLAGAIFVAACSTDPPPRRQPAPVGVATQAAAVRGPVADPPSAPARAASPATSRDEWNPTQIDWQPYQQGLARARAEHKPVCLVFFATWCPHCANYSHVFDDPGVVRQAQRFVMIRLDVDKNREISSRYQVDGQYVPRTFFLSPNGELASSITAERARFRYFYDERNAASLLGGMQRALVALGPSPASH